MKIVYVKSTFSQIAAAVEAADCANKKIDFIALTEAEGKELDDELGGLMVFNRPDPGLKFMDFPAPSGSRTPYHTYRAVIRRVMGVRCVVLPTEYIPK